MANEDSSNSGSSVSVSKGEVPQFPIVGVGASAGGLEAFRHLLQALPRDLGMAFVLIPHLAPEHRSMMAEILARETPMPVLEVHDQPVIEPNRVYVIPPNRTMLLVNRHLKLIPAEEPRSHHRSIDSFFRSLADDQGDHAIGVILSGTGTDGTLGAEAIKGAGGITFAQDQSAQHDSMPRSAIASGCIDFVLPPEAIAAELARIAHHPYLTAGEAPSREAVSPQAVSETELNRIFGLLRDNIGIDFGGYKSTTLYRRIMRRMVLHRLEILGDYLRMLETDATELQKLCRDVLISVTAFFRDPACFDTIKRAILPEILKGRPPSEPIRVWVIGCATGEEAYSLAIVIAEFLGEQGFDLPVQIFATDVDENAVVRARVGLYSKNIGEDVSPERLRRFFIERDGGYQIVQQIREMCVFARQNVLADPPFSHLDFASCRNLLIYMQPMLQKGLIPVFHYALRPGGFLWLGSSESIGGFGELFEATEPRQKIFKRKPGMAAASIGLATTTRQSNITRPRARALEGGITDVQREADKLTVAKYAPPSVILNADLEVQQFRGDTNRYLSQPEGKPTTNILKMAREGLLVKLRMALERARIEGARVRQEDVRIKTDSGVRSVNLEVMPLGKPGPERCFLVLFEERDEPSASVTIPPASSNDLAPDDELAHLTQELAATRDYMQSLIDQHEASAEELQTANEEIQSSNEELQSINEELQTSKEELQSTNEELTTVNQELHTRNEQLDRANNDLNNFIASSQLAMVMVGTDLRIRRFSPAAEQLLNLIGADIGRSIGEFRFGIELPDLEQRLTEAIHTLTPNECEVQDRKGRWYSLRVRPYRTTENRIDGATAVFVDIEAQKQDQEKIRAGEEKYRLLIEGATGIAIILLNTKGTVTDWNIGAERILGYSSTQIVGQHYDRFLGSEEVDRQVAARNLERAGMGAGVTDERWLRRRDGTRFWASLIITALRDKEGALQGFAIVVRDFSEKRYTEELRQEEDRRKDEFLATLAHELRNPLAPLANTLEALRQQKNNSTTVARGLERMERQVETLKRLVADILDVSRLKNQRIDLRREILDLRSVCEDAIEMEAQEIRAAQLEVSKQSPNEPVWVAGDRTRLEQIVANLLNNAAKYNDPGGRILLTLEISGPQAGEASNQAVIRVKDSGIGIEADRLKEIFGWFNRGDNLRIRQVEGLGVGLALVKGLAELHGGTVEAQSEGIGKGSEFIVRLPLVSAPKPSEGKESGGDSPGMQNKLCSAARRMLVVDDNVDGADALAELLRALGHQVQVAFTGSEALDAANAFKPELIFLDIKMPDMDGFEVARQLRQHRGSEKATLVALTGYGSSADRERSLAAGFKAHLVKPVDYDALAKLLRTIGTP
jgi:two-component system, chemotaxis family, CheB/CheR fusion protein